MSETLSEIYVARYYETEPDKYPATWIAIPVDRVTKKQVHTTIGRFSRDELETAGEASTRTETVFTAAGLVARFGSVPFIERDEFKRSGRQRGDYVELSEAQAKIDDVALGFKIPPDFVTRDGKRWVVRWRVDELEASAERQRGYIREIREAAGKLEGHQA